MFYASLFFSMLLLHFVADYTLQGWLANGKSKGWWEYQCEKRKIDIAKYKYDYICALICHAMYWTLITFIPFMFYARWTNVYSFVGFILAHTAIHVVVDDLKANRNKINLITDQLLHLAQIGVSVALLSII